MAKYSLTDNEKRIFLSAMAKEWKVCEEIDKKNANQTEVQPLVPIVDEIVRKVVGALWKN